MVSCNNNTSSSPSSTSRLALLAVVSALAVSSSYGFQQQQPVAFARRSTASLPTVSPLKPASSATTTTTALSMTLEEVNTFYQTYPLQAAVLTCGVKASLADCIAQVRSWAGSENAIELRRNAAYIIYGGIFIGLMCHIEYDILFPHLFGTTHDLKNIVQSVLFDNFISAPLMWLPPAYFIKAIMYDYPLQEGLERYMSDVMDDGLLLKYWSIWLPAQTISFSLVPDHLRVCWMATISFGWFIILSSAQQASSDAFEEAAAEETTSDMATEPSS